MKTKQLLIALLCIFAVAAVFPQIAQSQITDDLILYYSFDEGSGSTVIDHSPSNNQGEVLSTVWSTGKYGSGMFFNSSIDGKVQIDNSISFVDSMTISVWFNSTKSPSGGFIGVILDGGDYIYLPSATSIDGADFSFNELQEFSLNQWYMLTLTKNSTGNINLYINGQIQKSTGNIPTSFDFNNIAGYGDLGYRYEGFIDELRVYSKELTPQEITELYTYNPLATPTPTPTETPTPTTETGLNATFYFLMILLAFNITLILFGRDSTPVNILTLVMGLFTFAFGAFSLTVDNLPFFPYFNILVIVIGVITTLLALRGRH